MITQKLNTSIAGDYESLLCDDCLKTIEKEMTKVSKSKFPQLALLKISRTFHSKICPKCQVAIYNKSKNDDRVTDMLPTQR